MDYEDFITLTGHAEFAANNRPISQNNETLPLTPNMVVYGRNIELVANDSEYSNDDPDFTLVNRDVLQGHFKKLLKKIKRLQTDVGNQLFRHAQGALFKNSQRS